MALGYVDFTAGDVLTAAQVDGIMRQTMMSFATTSARDTALSGVLDEGMFAYTEDADAVWYYTGSAWKAFMTNWTSFTPAWTNLTIGNGTQDWDYRYIGGDLHVKGATVLGSTSSIGGTVTMTIPDSVTSSASGVSHGTASYLDDGTRLFLGISHVQASSTLIRFYQTETAYIVDATNPMTWATADELRCAISIGVD